MDTDIRSILESVGYVLRDDGPFWRTKPLYRDSKNPTSLRIRKSTGHWTDFSASLGGNLQELMDLTVGRPVDLSSLAVEDLAEIKECIRTNTNVKREWANATLVKSYNFYLQRGISQVVQEEFNLRVCQSGKMTRRVVFPIFDEEGEVMGIDGRTLFNVQPKWKKLGYKLDWVYPLTSVPHILDKNEAILVESIGDTLALYEAGIKNVFCIFGLKISSKVIGKLIELGVGKVIIATNNDKDFQENPNTRQAGNRASEKIAEKLLKFFDPSVINIKLPPKKDFGDMGKPEIINWYGNN
jgi:hypothetical protein